MPLETENSVKTMNEARFILLKNRPDIRIRNGVESKNYYIFDTVPKGYDEEKDGILMQNPLAVKKTDGSIIRYNPMEHLNDN